MLGLEKSGGVPALGALLLEHAFDEIGDLRRGGGPGRAAGCRYEGGPLAGRSAGKAFGKQRSEKLHEHECIDHAPLFGEKNPAEIGVAKTWRNVLVERAFQTVGLGSLSAGATETDFPAKPGNVFIITRLGFGRQL
jgi:hypothetical protein